MPKISVIIPSLNVEKYIDECLESVINQSLKDIEIICIDAGSSDGTLERLQHYAKQDKRIKLINSDKKSYGYQMNLGIKAAKGEFIGIVESDDYIKKDMYKKLYKIAKEKGVEVIKGDILSFEDQNNKRIFKVNPTSHETKFYEKIISYEKDGEEVLTKAWCMNQSGIYKLDFLREFDILFNETPGASYQDCSFWFQIFTLARSIYYVKNTHYCYRRDNPNSSSVSKAKIYCICDEYAFQRGFLSKYPNIYEKTAKINAYLRFRDYGWNLERIDNKYKFEFLQKMQNEFKELYAKGEIDESLFDEWQLKKLYTIVKSPYELWLDLFFKQKGALEKFKNQTAYKLGNTIIKAKNFKNLFKLPFNLYQIYKAHKLSKRFNENTLIIYNDYKEVLKAKKHLSYRLGKLMLNTKSFEMLILLRVYKKFKKVS